MNVLSVLAVYASIAAGFESSHLAIPGFDPRQRGRTVVFNRGAHTIARADLQDVLEDCSTEQFECIRADGIKLALPEGTHELRPGTHRFDHDGLRINVIVQSPNRIDKLEMRVFGEAHEVIVVENIDQDRKRTGLYSSNLGFVAIDYLDSNGKSESLLLSSKCGVFAPDGCWTVVMEQEVRPRP